VADTENVAWQESFICPFFFANQIANCSLPPSVQYRIVGFDTVTSDDESQTGQIKGNEDPHCRSLSQNQSYRTLCQVITLDLIFFLLSVMSLSFVSFMNVRHRSKGVCCKLLHMLFLFI
jgi:hypothetical protein